MSYSAFKKLDPVYILSSGILIAALCICAYFVAPLSGENSYPSLLAFYISSKASGVFLGCIFTLLGAYLMMFVINRHQIFKPKTFAPFLIFGLVNALYPANLYANSLMISNLFFIAALDKLLFLPSSKAAISHVLEASFFLGLASLFFWPAIFSMPVVLLAIIINGMFNLRTFLLWVIGFIAPWGIAWGVSFLWKLPFNFVVPYKSPDLSLFVNNDVALYSLLFCLAFGVFGLFFYFKSLEKTTVEVRNQKRSLGVACFVWLLSAYSSFLTDVDAAMFFVMLAPIMAFLMSCYLFYSKWKPLTLLFIVAMIAIIGFNYSTLILS